MKSKLLFLFTFLLLCPFLKTQAQSASDTFSVAKVLGSNMVVQRGKPFTVWGRGPAGHTITVTASWQHGAFKGKVNKVGAWEVAIPAAPANADPQNLEIKSKKYPPVIFTNILIGDVWVCSGQSNMTFPVDSLGPWPGSFGVENFAGEIASANYPSLLLFPTPYQPSGEPMEDISRETPCTIGKTSGRE